MSSVFGRTFEIFLKKLEIHLEPLENDLITLNQDKVHLNNLMIVENMPIEDLKDQYKGIMDKSPYFIEEFTINNYIHKTKDLNYIKSYCINNFTAGKFYIQYMQNVEKYTKLLNKYVILTKYVDLLPMRVAYENFHNLKYFHNLK